ncbi:MAG: DMT family transporter [Actinomycetota bacterium]
MSRGRPPLWALVALAVALLAVASSALLVRVADIGAVSLAFWRTAGGALVLTAVALLRPPGSRPPWPPRSARPLLLLSGLALAVHFAAWLASLELTTVAASVTLVSTSPLLIALFLAATGNPPGRATWWALMAAVVGAAVIAGGDVDLGGDALVGDALALVGAVGLAAYFLVGDRLRASVPTTTYAASVYAVAAAVLLPAALLIDRGLGGYTGGTWLAIGAMILGPQLAGHTVLNLLLRPLGSVTVSMALLTEAVLAGAGAWLLLDESPTVGVLVGGPVVLVALAVHLISPSPSDGAQSTNRPTASSR